MDTSSIASIISYCSLDKRFLPHVIASVRPFSQQIIIVLSDHLFDGTPEDHGDLAACFPDCTFVDYSFHADQLYGVEFPLEGRLRAHHLHNTPRLIGSYFVESDWALFLDADEVVDTERFMQKNWHKDAYRLASYWYFRSAKHQAITYSDSALLVRKELLDPEVILSPKERAGMAQALGADLMVMGTDEKPMIHHYSWVRTKEEMLKKVACWAHGSEDDWEALIQKEMAGPFSGTDFIYHYDYVDAEPFVDPMADNRHHVDPRTIYNLEVKRCFLTPTPT